MEQIPFLWVEKLSDGKWQWCVGPAEGDNSPTYCSVHKFPTERLAQQNAVVRLSGKKTPFTSNFDPTPFMNEKQQAGTKRVGKE